MSRARTGALLPRGSTVALDTLRPTWIAEKAQEAILTNPSHALRAPPPRIVMTASRHHSTRLPQPQKLLRAVVAWLLGRGRIRMVSPPSAKLIPPANEVVELPVDELAIRLLRLIPTSSTAQRGVPDGRG
jgi:hypothetical protein